MFEKKGSTNEHVNREMNWVPDIEGMKLAINNVLWMYASPSITLGELEKRAVKILDIVTEGNSNVR